VGRGYLEDADVKAIRIVDDENDIFSPIRCALLEDVKTGLPDANNPDAVRAHIQKTVKAKVASMPWAASQPKRKAFVEALLTPGVRRDVAQREYLAELSARYDAADKSATAVKAKERFRKARAREMFDNPRSNPLPILDLPK
jgi:hypothetical protein